MHDIYSTLATLALFACAFAYLAGCDRLKAGHRP